MTKFSASSKQLKYAAKRHLAGWYYPAVSATITVQLIATGLSIIIARFSDRNSLFGLILFYVTQTFVTLLLSLFTSGQCYMYLNISCGRPADSSMIFYGIKNQPEKAITIQFVQMLLYVIAMLPSLVVTFFGMFANIPLLVTMGTILMIPGGIIIAIWALSFSQAFYLLHDFPNQSAADLLRMSVQMMNGHKLRLLYILFSFLPLYLVALLTFGVGLLWVIPYMNAAMTEFFLDLMNQKNN